MQDVAADGDRQPGDAALGAADREGVEQRLRRMLMRAVAGVDDRAVDLLRQQLDGAGRVMAHDDDVGPHGVERHRPCRSASRPSYTEEVGDVHVHHVGAEPLAGHLERGLRARRGFEEEVDQRAPGRTSRFLPFWRIWSAALSARSRRKLISVADKPSQVSK